MQWNLREGSFICDKDVSEATKVVVLGSNVATDLFGWTSRVYTSLENQHDPKSGLGSIAGFSLLVGGIGLLNMMLLAIGERTREIGLRRAIGARRSDISLQFLSESAMMCSVGGILGIGGGIFAGKGMVYLCVKIVKIVPTWPDMLTMQ